MLFYYYKNGKEKKRNEEKGEKERKKITKNLSPLKISIPTYPSIYISSCLQSPTPKFNPRSSLSNLLNRCTSFPLDRGVLLISMEV